MDLSDKNGTTPLHTAAQNGCVECLRLLRDSGVAGTFLDKYCIDCF